MKPLVFTLLAALTTAAFLSAQYQRPEPGPYRALDGDTIAVQGPSPHLRLARIDAPELPGHCRPNRSCAPGDPWAAKAALQRLLNLGQLTCAGRQLDLYSRRLAECSIAMPGNRQLNLSNAMLSMGLAQPYKQRRR